VVAWAWDFGDGSQSSNRNPAHTYAAAGTYVVKLVATDDNGAASTAQASVTVSAPPTPSSISLSAVMRKVRGVRYADLTWSGAQSASIDIYRNNVMIVRTNNSGAYTDNPTSKIGSYVVYRICEAATSNCSASINVPW
jgi:PKD repeat protein